MTKDEALTMVLEALESVLDDSPKVLDASISGGLYEVVQCREAITALKEVLAQPKQEPVAWFYLHNCKAYFTTEPSEDMDGNYWTPLYTSPPQRTWVGLTTDERDRFTYIDAKDKARFRKHSDYIETTLKEKNQ